MLNWARKSGWNRKLGSPCLSCMLLSNLFDPVSFYELFSLWTMFFPEQSFIKQKKSLLIYGIGHSIRKYLLLCISMQTYFISSSFSFCFCLHLQKLYKWFLSVLQGSSAVPADCDRGSCPNTEGHVWLPWQVGRRAFIQCATIICIEISFMDISPP